MNLLPLEIEMQRQASTQAGYVSSLPGKTPNTLIGFGVTPEDGRFFRVGSYEGSLGETDSIKISLFERDLEPVQIVALLRDHGRPSPVLDRLIRAFSTGEDDGPVLARQIRLAMLTRAARFSEGPEGEREWEAWFSKQPQDFQEEWKSENAKHKDKFRDPQSKEAQHETAREAAGGLYGFTKQTQRDVEATIRKAQKRAAKIAQALFIQDNRTAAFLAVHSKRSKSPTAKLLKAAMKGFPAPKREATSDKIAQGLYGYPARTARLSLNACSDLHQYLGEITSNLHSRRISRHERILSFLKEHAKKARCGYSRVLLGCYPEYIRVAADSEGSGPLIYDEDEKYVGENFTQLEHHELSDHVEQSSSEEDKAEAPPQREDKSYMEENFNQIEFRELSQKMKRAPGASPQEKLAFMETSPKQKMVVQNLLSEVLAVMMAQRLNYQTSHWQVEGGNSYSNHLLFERLYDSMEDEIDTLAEKLVGYLGPFAVNLKLQIRRVSRHIVQWGDMACPHLRGLHSEKILQTTLRQAREGIREAGAMTLGLDDFLTSAASAHETHTYLLQQASTQPPDMIDSSFIKGLDSLQDGGETPSSKDS